MSDYTTMIYANRQGTQSSTKSQYSSRSAGSYSSTSTAATSVEQFEQESRSDKRPSLERDVTPTHHTYSYTYGSGSIIVDEEPETYYSDTDSYSSEDDYEYAAPSYLPESYPQRKYSDEAIPTTPSTFAEYFPGTTVLKIAHDIDSYDGDMNLIISTDEYAQNKNGKRIVHKVQPVQLYHLKMNDLATRKFSFRRYCRESGREVCETYLTPANRPALGRTMSNALASMKRTPSWSSAKSSKSARSMPVQRQDSGYASHEDEACYESGPDDEIEEEYFPSVSSSEPSKAQGPTNITKLLFTNLAQVYVKRKGQKANKHWDFEYWGKGYEWRRVAKADADAFEYRLYRAGEEDERKRIATIAPDADIPEYQKRAEERIGAFVPASTLQIHDLRALGKEDARADLADVIVASGVIALTDDSVRRLLKEQKAEEKKSRKPEIKRGLSFKVGQEKVELEFVTPRKMVEHWMKPKSKKEGKSGGLTISRPGTARSEGGKAPSSPLKYTASYEY